MSSLQTLCLSLLTASCMLGDGSRIAQGQPYASGDPTYDAFFRDVHQQQVDETSWGDDRRGRTSRSPRASSSRPMRPTSRSSR